MTVNIVSGFENIYKVMKQSIEAEMVEDGLLECVEDFIPVYSEDEKVDEPLIWMYQQETRPIKGADISQTMILQTPFQFNCAVYEPDIEDANTETQNLACRVVLSILKNWQTIQSTLLPGERMIRSIDFAAYYPLGTIEVNNKSERLPVTGVILNVNHIINWNNCCRTITDNEESNNGD